jgi:hypothetical protein
MKLSGLHKAVCMSGIRAPYPERYSEPDFSLAEANKSNGSAFDNERDKSLMANSSIRSHG